MAVARIAKANSFIALAVSRAIGWASRLAIILVESIVTCAHALIAFAMATAIIRAHLDGAITTVEALVARTRTIDAYTTVRAVVGTRHKTTVPTSEAGAAHALSLIRTLAIATAIIWACNLVASVACESREALALE